MKDKIVEQVVNKFNERSQRGITKYGSTLERNDLDVVDWMNHLQEELMDAILYLERMKKDILNALTVDLDRISQELTASTHDIVI